MFDCAEKYVKDQKLLLEEEKVNNKESMEAFVV